jgi:hypothetical protein
MSISNFVKSCERNVAGNSDILLVGRSAWVSALTMTQDKVSAITMASMQKFAYLEPDFDSVKFDSDGTSMRGYFSEQNLTSKFSKKTTALEKTISDISAFSNCGLCAIRIDNNGIGWLSGVAPATAKGNKPYHSVQDTFDTGESIEESEEGNRYTLILNRKSATKEYELDALLTASILDKTATFVNWPV